MAQLDEVSTAIGALRSDMHGVKRSIDALTRGLEDTQKNLRDHAAAMAANQGARAAAARLQSWVSGIVVPAFAGLIPTCILLYFKH